MEIFIELGLIIIIATIFSSFARMLKQPLIVGYILTGIVVGPYVFNILESTEYIELFSKLGISILLFILGLGLKPMIIREVGRVSTLAGVGQIVITWILGFFLMRWMGFEMLASIYGSLALTFSSTIIIFKLLSDRGHLDRLHGRISIGILLVQDIFAALVLLVVSVIGSAGAQEGGTFLLSLFFLIKGVSFFAILYFAHKYILPKISTFFAKSSELLFMFSISWGLGLSALFYIYGFSLEIGALAAGVALASSSFSEEISSRMKPLRDFFILLFFVLLGSEIVLSDIGSVMLPALLLSVFVLVGNPIIVIIIMNFLGYKTRTGFLTGLALAQISEFSLILMALGFSFGHLSQEVVSLITLVGIITIVGSSYLIIHADKIYPRVKFLLKFLEFKKHSHKGKEEEKEERDMIIFGYDRVGYDFVSIAEKTGKKYSVVDFNPNAIKKLEKSNIPYHFGDAEDINFLEEIRFTNAKIIISTIPDFKTNLKLVSYYRSHNKNGIVIVISSNIKDTKELYKHGASFVVMPHYLGASLASKMIEDYGIEAGAFEKEKKHHIEYLEKRQKLTEES
jgi:Kef-type K+ transport system membrane component KefB/Trk K+ transport system NAD-binding subunit